MKWAGAFLVTLAGLLWGQYFTRPLRQRIRALRDWERCLERLQVAVQWRKTPIAAALDVATREMPDAHVVALGLRQGLAQEDKSFQAAVGDALAQDRRLGADEREWLGHLLVQCSTAPTEFHAGAMASVQMELKRLRQALTEQDLRRATMIETLSTLAGIAVAVLML